VGWLTNWGYRKKHTITGSIDGAQTNYQIRFVVHYGSGSDSGEDVYCDSNCKTDFSDIRFTKSDGTTNLDYWIEEYTASSEATIWVEVDSIPANPSTVDIFVYYGNDSASSNSNGTNTFYAWDDFDLGYSASDPPKASRNWTSNDVYVQNNPTGRSGMGLKFNSLEASGTEEASISFTTSLSSVAINFKWHIDGTDYRNGYTQTTDSVATLLASTKKENGDEEYYDGESYQAFSPALSYAATTWYTYEWRLKTGYFHVTQNGTDYTGGRRNTGTPDEQTWNTYGNNTYTFVFFIDDVFVRKWVENEPAHSTWAEEEQANNIRRSEVTVSAEQTKEETRRSSVFAFRYWQVTGVTKDNTGSPLGSCDVYLFKDNLDNTVTYKDHVVSNAVTGIYAFTNIADNDAQYLVVAFLDGSPNRMDVTDHVLQPVAA